MPRGVHALNTLILTGQTNPKFSHVHVNSNSFEDTRLVLDAEVSRYPEAHAVEPFLWIDSK